MNEDHFRVSNKLCLFDETTVLLLQNHEGTWELPGGHLEVSDETPREGLERELREETGVEMKQLALLDPHKHKDVVALFWAAQPETTRVTTSDEHVDASWIPVEDLDDYEITFDELRDMIRSWHRRYQT